MSVNHYTARYLREAAEIAARIDQAAVDRIVEILSAVRDQGGRLFFLGVGGGAGHAGHAVNDFRKIAGIESYTPTDNVSELTARINDDGWESSFARWLEGSRLRAGDVVFVFSVGGGDLEKNISPNVTIRAIHQRLTDALNGAGIFLTPSIIACVIRMASFPNIPVGANAVNRRRIFCCRQRRNSTRPRHLVKNDRRPRN